MKLYQPTDLGLPGDGPSWVHIFDFRSDSQTLSVAESNAENVMRCVVL